MIRKGFKMQLLPGHEAEYKRRHDELWPEMVDQLHAAGVSDYTIYLDPDTLVLYGVLKLEDENTFADLPHTAIVKKWWAYMEPLMVCNPDNSPVASDLLEVFHID